MHQRLQECITFKGGDLSAQPTGFGCQVLLAKLPFPRSPCNIFSLRMVCVHFLFWKCASLCRKIQIGVMTKKQMPRSSAYLCPSILILSSQKWKHLTDTTVPPLHPAPLFRLASRSCMQLHPACTDQPTALSKWLHRMFLGT